MIMMSETTIEKLRKLNLNSMADEYDRQMGDNETRNMSFDDRLGLIVDIEFTRKKNNRLSRLIKRANFSDSSACVENISYTPDRKLDGTMIQTLASCSYIERNLNVQILGATGAGKSFLANAFGVSACRNSYTVKYVNLQDMLIELAIAKVEGTFVKTFAAYKKVKLLIIDDWLMFDIAGDDEASILYNLIESRKYSGSLIVCSQVDAKGWHSRISNKVAADSICDRLVNTSYKIVVEGEMRKKVAEKVFSDKV
jgi:DNA replication protein DnaC